MIREWMAKYEWPLHVPAAWNVIRCRAAEAVGTCVARFKFRCWGVRCGAGLVVVGPVIVRCQRRDSIRIGCDVRLIGRPRSNLVGLRQAVTLDAIGEGQIEVADGAGLSSTVLSSRSSIRIGRRAKLGGNARIFDHDFHSLDAVARREPSDDRAGILSRPVAIGDDVLVGADALILKGVTIGDRAIVGAGSVVTRDVPADEVWAGNPAQCIRRRDG